MASISEKEPLFHSDLSSRNAHTRSHHRSYSTTSSILLVEAQQTPSRSTLSLRTKLLLAMVAIPSYLLASSAISHLQPIHPLNKVIRSPTSSAPSPDPQSTPQAGSTASTTALIDGPFGSVLGPVVSSNFPDPAIVWEDGISYAFATNNRGIGSDLIHVQVATSTDNETWTLLPQDALPSIGGWQTGYKVWAPDVIRLDDGSYVMYYTDAVTWAPEHHCLGAAISQNVTGPYIPSDTPWACPDIYAQGGAIDPDGFLDPLSGMRYVTYKVDGNSIGHGGLCMNSVAPIMPTPIMLQEVAADGVTKVGDPVQILDRDDSDGPLIEAPSLHRSDEGIYFLFFSSNCFTTPRYDTSYATATSIDGPYTKAGRPLLITGDGPDLVGPGGLDIITDGSMVVFHGHMTVNNSPAYKELVDGLDKQASSQGRNDLGKPNTDIPNPLIRGMYGGVATFNGTDVSLVKTTSW